MLSLLPLLRGPIDDIEKLAETIIFATPTTTSLPATIASGASVPPR